MHTSTLSVRAVTGAAAVSLAVVGLAVPTAAAPPEVLEIDRTFENAWLTEECGVPVVQHLWGTFSTTYHGDRTITQYRFRSTLTSGDVVIDSRASGPTIEQRHEDGSVTVTQLGVTMRNLPGSGTAGPFAGRTVVRVPVEGGEVVVSESGFRQDSDELCAALRG